nr:hypothetical protein [Actinosynnema pretiosum]
MNDIGTPVAPKAVAQKAVAPKPGQDTHHATATTAWTGALARARTRLTTTTTGMTRFATGMNQPPAASSAPKWLPSSGVASRARWVHIGRSTAVARISGSGSGAASAWRGAPPRRRWAR